MFTTQAPWEEADHRIEICGRRGSMDLRHVHTPACNMRHHPCELYVLVVTHELSSFCGTGGHAGWVMTGHGRLRFRRSRGLQVSTTVIRTARESFHVSRDETSICGKRCYLPMR